MSNALAPKNQELVAAAKGFKNTATNVATAMLTEWVGEARAKEAIGRITTALSASAASAKNPSDFYACTPQSVARVVALSALTGIMVSTGQGALAYAIPRRPRKNEQPQLQYQLSHRGIAALAKRAGLSLIAYPIGVKDSIEFDEAGEVIVRNRDIDNPPSTEHELRGVLVLVRSIATGVVLSRGFVSKSVINARRAISDSYKYAESKNEDWAKEQSTWHKWYVEMAIKTAMHYAINRGWCVIDDTEAVRALQADGESDYTPAVAPALTDDRPASERLEDKLMGEDPAEDTAQASDPQDN